MLSFYVRQTTYKILHNKQKQTNKKETHPHTHTRKKKTDATIKTQSTMKYKEVSTGA